MAYPEKGILGLSFIQMPHLAVIGKKVGETSHLLLMYDRVR